MPWPLRFLAALARRLGPVEGWLSLVGLGLAVLALAWSIEDAGWTPGAPSTYAPVLVATAAGILLAKRVPHQGVVAATAVLLGVSVSVLTASRALPPASVFSPTLRYLAASLQSSQAQANGIPAHIWMLEHLSRWLGSMQQSWAAVSAGRPAPGNEPLILAILLLLWFVAFWAGWATYRRHEALVALAPAGVLLAANLFLALRGTVALMIYLAGLLLLAVALREYTLRQQWQRQHVDYSDELRLDLYLSGIGLAIVVLTVPPIVPNLSLHALQRAFWQVVQGPAQSAQTKIEIVFPALNRRPGELDVGAATADVLPRAHLLQSGPDLRQRVVLRVSTGDRLEAMPSADYRWRQITYSVYTGKGWTNPQADTSQRYGAGESWSEPPSRGRRPLQQRFDFVAAPPAWLVAAGDPIAVDHPYAVHLRSPGDAIGLEARYAQYLVISEIPAVSEEELRASSGALPDPIASAYLELPPTVPPRVATLAQAITAEAASPYDKAAAIAAYLRRFPYTLDVPAPPPGSDVADYFLFTLQRGYCDYFATAMVVLARAAGLPARLAIGYAAGDLDAKTGKFTVTEADAHSWPEIYFPQYGWIPFEPTPSRSELVRAVGNAAIDAELPARLQTLQREAWRRQVERWSLPLLGVLLLLLAGRYAWVEGKMRRQAANPWQLAYLRLERWGRRLGITPAPWLTPHEYTQQWRRWLASRPSAAALALDIDALGTGLERRAYAPPAERPSDGEAGPLSRRIRLRLWRMRLLVLRERLRRQDR